MGKEIQVWADEAMFAAEPLNVQEGGPKVYLLSSPSDPLGDIAACAKMYKGEVVRNLAEVTDKERLHYLAEIQKTKLAMPLEAVQFHFMIEGVSRGFTHQMVRQRTASYAQESMRFAVIEDSFTDRVALPPSLAGVPSPVVNSSEDFDRLSNDEKNRYDWDEAVKFVEDKYVRMILRGMPAEDARGLLPTNITTRLHYNTNLRSLLEHAGNRLCTQAQFEWRLVLAQLANSIREYGVRQSYVVKSDQPGWDNESRVSSWQFNAIADLLRPVCYQVGKCVMKADFDRKCSIRDRVDANAKIGRPSSEWGEPHTRVADKSVFGEAPLPVELGIPSIRPAEWLLDPAAAR